MSRFFLKNKNAKYVDEMVSMFHKDQKLSSEFEQFLEFSEIEFNKKNPEPCCQAFIYWYRMKYPSIFDETVRLPETFSGGTIIKEEEIKNGDIKKSLRVIASGSRGKALREAQQNIRKAVNGCTILSAWDKIKKTISNPSILYEEEYRRAAYDVFKDARFAQLSGPNLKLFLQNFQAKLAEKGKIMSPVDPEFAAHCFLNHVKGRFKLSAIQTAVESAFPKESDFKDTILAEVFKERDIYFKAVHSDLQNVDTRLESKILSECLQHLQEHLVNNLKIDLNRFDEGLAAQCFLDLVGEKFGCSTVIDTLKRLDMEKTALGRAIKKEIESREEDYDNAIDDILDDENVLKNGAQNLSGFLQNSQEKLANKLGISPRHIDPRMAAKVIFDNINRHFGYQDIKNALGIAYGKKGVFEDVIEMYIDEKKEKYSKFFSDVFEPLSSSEKDGESLSKFLPFMLASFTDEFKPVDWQLAANSFLDSDIEYDSLLDVENILKMLPSENLFKNAVMEKIEKEKEKYSKFFSDILEGGTVLKNNKFDLTEVFRMTNACLGNPHSFSSVGTRMRRDEGLAAKALLDLIKEKFDHSALVDGINRALPGHNDFKDEFLKQLGPVPVTSNRIAVDFLPPPAGLSSPHSQVSKSAGAPSFPFLDFSKAPHNGQNLKLPKLPLSGGK